MIIKLINYGEGSVKVKKIEGFNLEKKSLGRELKELNQNGLYIRIT